MTSFFLFKFNNFLMGRLTSEYLEIFDINLFLVKADTYEELEKLWDDVIFYEGEKYPLPNWKDTFHSCKAFAGRYEDLTDPRSKDLFFVARKYEEWDRVEATIAHEAFHLLNMLFSIIGHRHSTSNDELHAYILGHLVQIITNFLNYEDEG